MNSTEQLLSLNVNKHLEKKNGLSYLSWAWAWDQALRVDPNATFHVDGWTRDDGTTQCWMEVNGTAMVWVRVTMLGQTRTCMLPVMNAKNEPISIEGRKYKDKYGNEKVEKLDAFNVNTAIMRCMTKCLALFGLGLYIYAGEDLPLEEDEPKAEKREKKVEEPKPPKTNASEADLGLFAEGLKEALAITKTESGLRSLWLSNEIQLDALKEKLPAVHEQVLDSFRKRKGELKGEASE